MYRQAIRTLRLQCHKNQRHYSSGSPISYLIVEGYTKAGREDLLEGGAIPAGELYAYMLTAATKDEGRSVTTHMIYPAEEGFEMPDVAQFDAVGWSGSSLSVCDTASPIIQSMLTLARNAYAKGVPQFGSCFGAQIAVQSAGGTVIRNPLGKELGVGRKIRLTPTGRSHPLYEGKSSVFDGFVSHKDQIVQLPISSASKLSENFYNMQAVAVQYLKGDFWALQYHPEYDCHEFARLLSRRREVSVDMGFFQDLAAADAYIQDLEDLHNDPDRLDLRWKLGIDDDILDTSIRTREVRNFVRHLVLPTKAKLNA